MQEDPSSMSVNFDSGFTNFVFRSSGCMEFCDPS